MEWYIRGVSLIDGYNSITKREQPEYLITLWNTLTNTEMNVYLERDSFLNDFYGLYVVKNGNKQEQLLRIEWIKDMDRFLNHIRALTNETNGIVNKQGVVRGCK
jgi:predicted Zn-dependent protease